MTILSKEALDKIRKERAILDGEDSADENKLFNHLDKTQQKGKLEKQENEDYDFFEDGDFYSFDPNNE